MMDAALIARFGLAGLACTLVHFAVVWMASSLLGWPLATANGLAYVVANVVSYLLQSRFTFRARPKSLPRWCVASALLLGLSLVAGHLAEAALPRSPLAWLAAALPVVAASYFVMRLWVFPRAVEAMAE